MTYLGPIISQVTYPGVGDIDECGMMATIQAALAANPALTPRRPTVAAFRAAAGDPDDGRADGWSLTELLQATRVIWPAVKVVECRAMPFADWARIVRAGGASSVSVHSQYLPFPLRFGFLGLHQVAVAYDNGWKLANPLAPNGSAPADITEADLRRAIDHYSTAGVYAAHFPEDAVIRTRISEYPTGPRAARGVNVTGYLEDGRTHEMDEWTGYVSGTASVTREDGRAPKGTGFVVGASRPFTGYLIPASQLVIDPAKPDPAIKAAVAAALAHVEPKVQEALTAIREARPE